MKLEEFTPQSELRVPETQIDGPKYPVYDAHAHFGKLLLGDDYASRYDTLEEVARFKSLGVKRIVNLDGFYGDDLDRMLEKTAPAGDFFRTFGSVDVTRLDEPGFASYVYKTIRDGKRKGISGLKFWKVIGLNTKTGRAGTYARTISALTVSGSAPPRKTAGFIPHSRPDCLFQAGRPLQRAL